MRWMRKAESAWSESLQMRRPREQPYQKGPRFAVSGPSQFYTLVPSLLIGERITPPGADTAGTKRNSNSLLATSRHLVGCRRDVATLRFEEKTPGAGAVSAVALGNTAADG